MKAKFYIYGYIETAIHLQESIDIISLPKVGEIMNTNYFNNKYKNIGLTSTRFEVCEIEYFYDDDMLLKFIKIELKKIN